MTTIAMTDKTPCTSCQAMILSSTAERTGGVCMPCVNGTRASLEAAKQAHARERELERTCPFRRFWRELVDRVHGSPNGFDTLSDNEKQYFAVRVLDQELYNGGFDQYFYNSSGDTCRFAELGLMRIGAMHSLALLRSARLRLFGSEPVPREQDQRRAILSNTDTDLDDLEDAFCEDPDQLESKLEQFAREAGLVRAA